MHMKLTIAAIAVPAAVILLVLAAPGSPAFPQRAAGTVSANDVHIGVLGLFHPREFMVSTVAGTALVIQADEERIVLEQSSGIQTARVRIDGNAVVLMAGVNTVRAATLVIKGRRNEPVNFVLAVPDKFSRHYRGTLEIKPAAGELLAVVAMDRETAVASVVAAESTPGTPLEALKAQAVAARSYLIVGSGRHRDFDACDTTHCQFLREPPAPDSAVAKAVAATRGLVLAYDSRPFAAMYTRSCGGQTHTPAELNLPPATYPYYSVECEYCRAHPARWISRISAKDATALHSSDESARLKLVRRLGWSAVPSNDFIIKKENRASILEGTGRGHGIGLCQSGARAMAEKGAGFRQILSHYYPNTALVDL